MTICSGSFYFNSLVNVSIEFEKRMELEKTSGMIGESWRSGPLICNILLYAVSVQATVFFNRGNGCFVL